VTRFAELAAFQLSECWPAECPVEGREGPQLAACCSAAIRVVAIPAAESEPGEYRPAATRSAEHSESHSAESCCAGDASNLYEESLAVASPFAVVWFESSRAARARRDCRGRHGSPGCLDHQSRSDHGFETSRLVLPRPPGHSSSRRPFAAHRHGAHRHGEHSRGVFRGEDSLCEIPESLDSGPCRRRSLRATKCRLRPLRACAPRECPAGPDLHPASESCAALRHSPGHPIEEPLRFVERTCRPVRGCGVAKCPTRPHHRTNDRGAAARSLEQHPGLRSPRCRCGRDARHVRPGFPGDSWCRDVLTDLQHRSVHQRPARRLSKRPIGAPAAASSDQSAASHAGPDLPVRHSLHR
jgi:hypothetical protein